jgi:hypothetical protein
MHQPPAFDDFQFYMKPGDANPSLYEANLGFEFKMRRGSPGVK